MSDPLSKIDESFYVGVLNDSILYIVFDESKLDEYSEIFQCIPIDKLDYKNSTKFLSNEDYWMMIEENRYRFDN